jgi:hypothetical protein
MSKTYIINPNCGYLKRYEHLVPMNGPGVRSGYVEWCNVYCEGLWGWHFDSDPFRKFGGGASTSSSFELHTEAFMTFELTDDMIIFKLSCLTG